MKRLIKKLIPEGLLLSYHYCIAILATVLYGFPAKKLIVIGVTGTKGKTSTINFIWSCLQAGGIKTGIISTANIRIGEKEFMNEYHMTMPGRFTIQRLIAQMVREGCRVCLVETTSEGIKQYRHTGIYYDIAVLTNLSPEHLPSHGGSFEKYRQMKGRLFQSLQTHKKIINGENIEKVIIANTDNEHAEYYLKFPADRKITYGIQKDAEYRATNIEELRDGVRFSVGNNNFLLSILGKFNVYNALPGIIIARLLGIPDQKIATGLTELRTIPGRMEQVNVGQNFQVIVDYAHEKESITALLQTANNMKGAGSKIIILLGAEGGGRDKSKRPVMGQIAAQMADYVVVSNVDPYDDDPVPILEDIASSATNFGKIRNKDLFVIEDRRVGIHKAVSLARSGDIVLITGKGAEQSMIVGGKAMPWDDRLIVREELKSIDLV